MSVCLSVITNEDEKNWNSFLKIKKKWKSFVEILSVCMSVCVSVITNEKKWKSF
jgi:hypothetical protein